MNQKEINTPKTSKKYEVTRSKKLGRYLVATENIARGEVIFRENAVSVGPAIFAKNIFCFSCMRTLSNCEKEKKVEYNCSKCNVAPLCNQICENSIGYHTVEECNFLADKKDFCQKNIEELMRILLHLRLWLLKDNDPQVWDVMTSMEAHINERRNLPVWQDREMTIVNVFRKLGLASADEEVQWLCGILDVNSFELRTPGGLEAKGAGAPLLRGLFLEASLMAHACRGTAHVTVDEAYQMTVHAALPLRPGDLITFNYTSSLLGTIERQEHLQEGKYFRCECKACIDPFENGSYLSCILCPRCKKDYVAIQKPQGKDSYGRKTKWQCRKCKRIFRGCLINSTIEITKDLISQINKENHKAMKSLLEKLFRTFHTNHFLMISLKQSLLAAYRNEIMTRNPQKESLQSMIKISKELLDVLEIVEPGISRLKGILLYEMHIPMSLLANRAYAAREISVDEMISLLEEARGYLNKSLTILLLEPAATPEGLLAKRALQEMKLLMLNIQDAKAMTLPKENSKRPLRTRNGQCRNFKPTN